MNILEIDGWVPVQPKEFHMDTLTLSSENSGEDLTGYTHQDPVRFKRKLYYTWGMISWADCAALLQKIQAKNSVNLNITYPDRDSGKIETRAFLAGDRTGGTFYLIDGEVWVDGLQINFNEHGGDLPT